MADELIDIFDENMNFLGTVMKSQAHREGLWHKTFHCWLAQKTEEGKTMLWLQLRKHNKDIFPNKLDITAAGHIKAGEEVKDGYREIEEELGIKLNKDEIIKLFTSKEIYEIDIYDDGSEIQFTIHGNDFLHNMARMMLGTLVDIGLGNRKKEEIEQIFDVKSKTVASAPVDPKGLFLQEVIYK